MKINFQRLSFLTLSIFILGFFALPNLTNAQYLASDLLGQLDGSNNPVFTGSAANNGEAGPNAKGMSVGVRQPAIDFIHHRIFFADYNSPNSRVLVFNLDEDNNLIDRVADNVLGQPSLTVSNFAVTQSSTYSPGSVAYDPVRNYVYVSQTDVNRVSIFDVADITDGEDAIFVLGQADFTSGAAATTQSGMSYPYGVAYDSVHSRLFVSERFNNRVLVFDLSSGITNGMNAAYVLGQSNFTSAVAATTQSGMSEAAGMDFDERNNRLFVFERLNRRVLVFDLSSGITNGMNASYVLGQTDFTSAVATVTQSNFNNGIGDVEYDDASGKLFVSDNNQRVLIFNASPSDISNGANAVAVIGQADYVTNTNNLYTQSGIPGAGGVVYDPDNNRLYVSAGRRASIFDFVKLSTTNPSNATRDTVYSQSLSTTNSQGTVSYAITSGALPTGLSLNTSTGEISGTPTVAGSYNFTVQATDDNGAIGYFLSQPQEYTLVVNEPPSNTSGSRPTRARTTTVPVSTESVVTTPIVQVVELTTPNTTNYTFTRALRIKDTGEDVKELQKYLNTHGYPVAITGPGSLGNETTYFGLLTHSAVVKFQLANKLVGDGVVGPMTRAFLK